jgi:biotin-(acetyl-CoA carboxylase) ligase
MPLTINIKMPMTDEEIKAEATRLRHEITQRSDEIEVLASALRQVQKQCKHKGQQTGYNERDGDWANPCPTCGESH